MKYFAGLLIAIAWLAAAPASAQPTSFEHIVIIVQENRTPDNLFYALCATQTCSTNPNDTEYDIQTQNWLDKNAQGGTIQPTSIPLANTYDLGHTHDDFVDMCDREKGTNICRMDGAGDITCGKACPPNAEFKYVDNSGGLINSYLFLATQYGWANHMFQTNQGPSFPAHQFLFGATSAPSGKDDHRGTFVAENLKSVHKFEERRLNGCIASPGSKIQLINAKGKESPNNQIYPCLEHQTIADLLDKQSVSWRYYTPGPGNLWSAPDAIKHICEPSKGKCAGPIWQSNVALTPLDIYPDLANCNLRGVSWVIPSAQFSDHAKYNKGGGPAWVASIVNAIGNSTCKNADGTSYWDSTAIIVVWDDWGGWYDHERPRFLPFPEGGYQYGFRVPMIFVSAYTPKGYINNLHQDFGSIARFIESNFGITMGKLTFADARSKNNLEKFYDFSMTARTFQPVPASSPASFLEGGKLKLEPPDDD